jgi:MFS family permease
VHWVLVARFMDRIGKGVRGAPRDALIADLTPPAIRGAAYGLRQSLDTVGAFLGPLLAVGLMLAWANDFRMVFWFAVLPAIASVLLLALGVREPDTPVARGRLRSPVRWETLGELGGAYWWVVAAGSVFTLARFSEAFLILRASELGLPDAFAPLVLVLMNFLFAASAYPVGWLSDRVSHRALLIAGLAVLVAADLVLAHASALGTVGVGVALWGLHMGITQGLLAAMVSHAAPAHLRGTAFGVFSLGSGIAMLAASVLAGALWDRIGAATTFYCGAGFALLALVLLAVRGGHPTRS